MSTPSAIVQLSASGEVSTAGSPRVVLAVILTAAAAASTATLKTGGSGGTPLLTLAAAANSTTNVTFNDGVVFGSGCYVTLTGAGALVSVSYA